MSHIKDSGRIVQLESLRAIMAWTVVVNHAVYMYAGPNTKWIGRFFIGAGQAVEVFIILSGFVITYLLENKNPSKLSFYGGRFFRLWPLLMFSLLMAFVTESMQRQNLEAMIGVLDSAQWRLDRMDIWDNHDTIYFPISALMLHAIVPEFLLPHCDKYRVSPAWSIGLEWSFYIVAPFIISAARKRGKSVISWCAILAFCVIFNWVGLMWNKSSIIVYAPLFALGIGSYYLYANSNALLAKYPPVLIAALLLIVGALGGEATLIWAVVLLVLFPAICSSVAPIGLLSRILENPILRYLGKISYSTYLMHWFGMNFVQWLMLNYFGVTPESLGWSWMAYALVAIVVLALSVISYHLIEMPFMRLGRSVMTSNKLKHA